MDNQQLAEFIDQQRWLMNNGLISDSVKNQLFFCGSIVHKDVQAVELEIRPESRLVEYKIYVNKDLISKIAKYKALSTSTSLFGLWRFKRLLKQEGSLEFQSVLNKFVIDFCGASWRATVEVLDFANYIDGLGEQGENSGSRSADKLPD
jgi:hypothetical protein